MFVFFLGKTQERSYPRIDTALSRNYFNTHQTGKFEDGIKIAQKLIDRSKDLNYNRGMTIGYMNIGNFLTTLNRYEESLKYFELAEKRINKTKDYSLKGELYTDYGKVNHFLGLYDIALDNYNIAISAGKKITDMPRQEMVLQYAYLCKADNFTSLKQIDSMYVYFQKGYKLLPDAITAANIANYFIVYKKSKIDSAEFYLKTAVAELNRTNYESYEKLAVLSIYGDFHSEKENYHSALDYYFKALAVAVSIRNNNERRNLYQQISNTYKALEDDEKSAEYLQKYTIINDSLNSVDKKALNISVNKLVRDKELEKENEIQANKYLFIFISCVVIVLVIFGYVHYVRKKKEKESVIHTQQEVIVQSQEEKRKLEYKVNDAFDEIFQLAKKNNPAFLARFKEVYPEFCEKLLKRYPDISSSELTFCAYLKLNLSTKDIAGYTFVTEKTVQSRKSRLRKRMNISSGEDLYIWISKI